MLEPHPLHPHHSLHCIPASQACLHFAARALPTPRLHSGQPQGRLWLAAWHPRCSSREELVGPPVARLTHSSAPSGAGSASRPAGPHLAPDLAPPLCHLQLPLQLLSKPAQSHSCLALPLGLYRLRLWFRKRSSLRITHNLSSPRGMGWLQLPHCGCYCRHPRECHAGPESPPWWEGGHILTERSCSCSLRTSWPVPYPGIQQVLNKH